MARQNTNTPSDGDRTAPVDVESYKHPMKETGAVTEDKPVGQLIPQPSKVGEPRLPQPPSFKISEGTRAELAMHGTARCPFTGRTLKAEDFGIEVEGKGGDDDGVSVNASGLL